MKDKGYTFIGREVLKANLKEAKKMEIVYFKKHNEKRRRKNY